MTEEMTAVAPTLIPILTITYVPICQIELEELVIVFGNLGVEVLTYNY